MGQPTPSSPTAQGRLRILHLGLGSFHRAHQAVYLQKLIDSGDARWVLAAGNLRPDMPDLIDTLIRQHGEYTLETVSPALVRDYQRIRAIGEVVPWSADHAGLIALARQAQTRIISFTVTEAGYYLDDRDQLDMGFADLKEDIAGVRAGRPGKTIYGALVTLLRARRESLGSAVDARGDARGDVNANAKLTLLNCDNLRHNGSRARSGLVQFVQAIEDPALLGWIEANTSFPNAMVDRITPRPTPAVRERVKAATGVDDPAALMAEDFIQWVIEDRFANGRPEWEHVGVEMVKSVDAHEEAKIRLLNATHSCIAWAGTLCGYRFIHEGTKDPAIRAIAHDYVTADTIPVLSPSPIDLAKYRDVVLDRFANPAIEDTNQRVAADGFSKIPGFIAPTIRERLARNESIDAVAMLPALFLAFLQRWSAGGIPYEYQDQAMDAGLARAICADRDPVAAMCNDRQMWGPLAGDLRLVEAVRKARARVDTLVAAHAVGTDGSGSAR